MTGHTSIIEIERSGRESNERGSRVPSKVGDDVHIEAGHNEDSASEHNAGKAGRKRKKRPKKIACRECRQQKARCDAFDRAPGPCSRCAKRKIECVLDSDYKRTFKRVQIARMERDYELMRQRLQHLAPRAPILRPQGPYFGRKPVVQMPNLLAFNSLSPTPVGSNSMPSTPLPSASLPPTPLAQTQSPAQLPTPLPPTPLQQVQLRESMLSQLPSGQLSSGQLSSQQMQLGQVQLSQMQLNQMQRSQQMQLNRQSQLPSQQSPLSNQPSPLPQPNQRSQLPHLANRHALPNTSSTSSTSNTLPNENTSNTSNKLQSTSNTSNTSPNKHTLPNENASPNKHTLPNENASPNKHTNQNTPPNNQNYPAASVSRTLGDLTLTPGQISQLFSHFVRHYQPSLPVVDVSRGIDCIYRLCPILFWTLMATALRTFSSRTVPREKARRMYFELSPRLKSALAELSIAPITRYAPSELDEPVLNVCSVYTVQAFLLYTFWPPLTSSISADSSWYSAGIALFQAIRIGLHIPGHSADGLTTNNPRLLREQARTWAACNVVSQIIATAFGFPSVTGVQPAAGVGASIDASIVPTQLRQMLAVQRFESRLARALNSNPFDPLMLAGLPERYPLLRLLEAELDALQLHGAAAPIDAPIDDFRLLSLLAARLHLTTYYFFDADKAPPYDLARGLLKAYDASLALIRHCTASQHRNHGFAAHLPPVYTVTIWQAACVIARLVLSSYAPLLDVARGKTAYLDAVALCQHASVIKHDLAYRASGIMRCMWGLFETLHRRRLLSPTVVVRSRMCASVFFDSLWILRRKCGMIQLHPEQKDKADREAAEAAEAAGDGENQSEENQNGENDEKQNGENQSGENQSGENQGSGNHTREDLQNNPSGSNKDFSKKPHRRSLSESLHPESDARKIISTIPLDPQPISLSDNTDRESSTQSSPFVHRSPVDRPYQDQYRNSQDLHQNSQDLHQNSQDLHQNSQNLHQNSQDSHQNSQDLHQNSQQTTNSRSPDTPVFSLDSWDLAKDIDSDLLFKDIDTVMNDFGFHAE
ncbi:hypothetical protein HII12_001684 [Brettanomyces bruxellensis]|uniref:Zn(2)-C6 fungal-type domain-containing protein n=1 Tax=Dekkera bruxellensis TaxID=5007 RepID=A0A8H6BL34_DEKBR|nr:hypothetical protein HII12_001684 [Brettanomyces bruxellensis]